MAANLYSQRLNPLTVSVPAMSEWTSYTSTATNFTFSTQDFRWRRVGNTIEIVGRFSTTGTGVASTASVTIPSGLTMDTSQWPAAAHVGRWANNSSTDGNYKTGSIYVQPSNSTTVNFSTADIVGTTSAFSLLAGSHISPAAVTIHVHFIVPITGWTSHTASAATANAVTTTGTQTITGAKTFDGGALIAGRTDGANPGASYIGYSVEGTQTSLTSFPATGTYADGASVTLPAGRWLLTALLDAEQNGATGTAIIGAIGTTTGNSLAGATAGDTLLSTSFPTVNNNTSICIASSIKNITVSTTYYLKVGATFSAGTPRYRCRLTAVRIA